MDLNECLLTSDGSSLDVIHVRTIFPSIKDEEGKTKGGIILLRARIRDGIDITQIRVSCAVVPPPFLSPPLSVIRIKNIA